MLGTKKWLRLVLAAAVFIFFGACDDINRPVTKPFLTDPANLIPKGKEVVVDVKKELVKQDLERWYHFMVERFDDMSAKSADLFAAREAGARDEPSERRFVVMCQEHVRRIKIFHGVLPLTDVEYPDGHPTHQIRQTAVKLDNYADNLIHVFGRDKAYNSTLGEEVGKEIELIRELLDNYHDPEEGDESPSE